MSNKLKLPPLEDIEKGLEKELIEFAKWFNYNQWVGGKGDYNKSLFVNSKWNEVIALYFKYGSSFLLPYLQQAIEELRELREEVERLKKENEQLKLK